MLKINMPLFFLTQISSSGQRTEMIQTYTIGRFCLSLTNETFQARSTSVGSRTNSNSSPNAGPAPQPQAANAQEPSDGGTRAVALTAVTGRTRPPVHPLPGLHHTSLFSEDFQGLSNKSLSYFPEFQAFHSHRNLPSQPKAPPSPEPQPRASSPTRLTPQSGHTPRPERGVRPAPSHSTTCLSAPQQSRFWDLL